MKVKPLFDKVVVKLTEKEETTKRTYKFGKELLIERADFEVNPPAKYHRLYVGNKVRLKGAFVVTCTGYDLNEDGTVKCVYAEYDPTTKSGGENSNVKVKGTIHWLNEKYAKTCEVRHFENLLSEEDEGTTNERQVANEYKLNPNSISIIKNAYVESDIEFTHVERYQFIRNGFYCLDSVDGTDEKLVFNRVVDLKGSYKPQTNQ